jgi:hypothetical protein
MSSVWNLGKGKCFSFIIFIVLIVIIFTDDAGSTSAAFILSTKLP